MKRVVLVAGCFVVALLVGRYVIPSRGNNEGAPRSRPQDASTAARTEVGGQMETSRTSAHTQDSTPEAQSEQANGSVAQGGTGVFINGQELTRDQVMAIAATYRYAPLRGHYWYDSQSGAWGFAGHETVGFLLPGHDFGPLAADASEGNTGVFINGRQLNMIEAVRIQQTFGAVYQGHWWLDGRTGNFGVEGNPMPVGNLIAMVRAQQSTRRGDNFWCSTTACGNDNGQSGYVDVGGKIAGYDR